MPTTTSVLTTPSAPVPVAVEEWEWPPFFLGLSDDWKFNVEMIGLFSALLLGGLLLTFLGSKIRKLTLSLALAGSLVVLVYLTAGENVYLKDPDYIWAPCVLAAVCVVAGIILGSVFKRLGMAALGGVCGFVLTKVILSLVFLVPAVEKWGVKMTPNANDVTAPAQSSVLTWPNLNIVIYALNIIGVAVFLQKRRDGYAYAVAASIVGSFMISHSVQYGYFIKMGKQLCDTWDFSIITNTSQNRCILVPLSIMGVFCVIGILVQFLHVRSENKLEKEKEGENERENEESVADPIEV